MDEITAKIKKSLNLLTSISNAVNHNSTVQWFNELCQVLSDTLITIANYVKNCNSNYVKNIKKTLLLYLTQLITVLSLLIRIFLNENELNDNINEARNFTVKQLDICLNAIDDILRTGKLEEANNGSFLKWMDLSLDKLAEIDVENDKENSLKHYQECKSCIEEVLCHAMSIAQVSYLEDCKIIKGSSKTVLEELDVLYVELNKDDFKINLCNLMIDSCYDKLCALERKVNYAVLRLSLKVFSQFTVPLEKLNAYCLNTENAYNEEHFDNLVVDFDLHVDRIVQIGFFAIAASTTDKISVRMKSCLASLEALEADLIPSFNNVLINPTKQSRNFANILEQYWVQQAESLRELVYTIVDPFAFTQVVYEELKTHTDKIFESIKSNTLTAKSVEPVLNEGQILIDLVTVTTATGFDNVKQIKSNCVEIKTVLHEVKSAVKLLLGNNTPVDCMSAQRIFKRVKILKGSVRKLLFSLSNSDLDEGKRNETSQDSTGKNSSGSSKNDEKLNEIIHRGKELLSERSILYRTPTKKIGSTFKCKTSISKYTNYQKPMPLLKMVHLRNLQFSYSKIYNESNHTDLQVTDILADLENISSSFPTM